MKNKGISLIVLIITIVVIIILAAAIILNLKDTNIIENANEAVVKQDFKTFESELDLYIADEYVDKLGKLDITTIDATTKEDVVKIIPSIKDSKYEEYVTIVDGEIVISDTMPEEQRKWANEVINSGSSTPTIPESTETPVIQAGTEVKTANSSITGEDFSSINPVIPVGFKAINTDDASWNTDENGVITDWNKGLVIQDRSGNEFVWVPCTLDENDTSKIQYKKRFEEYPKTGMIINVEDNLDALPDVVTYETTQIEKYGGFYIGRYEAGVPEGQTTVNGENKDTSNVDGTPVVKRGATSWTYISYSKAMQNAKILHVNSTSVKSGIVTGSAWDTTCAWIESEKDNTGKSIYDVVNSKSWGNYSDTVEDAKYDKDGTTKISGKKQVTGKSEYWKAKNIYDFAGNTYELSGESNSSSAIFRSGSFNNEGVYDPAAFRGDCGPTDAYSNISFRIMLYVL